MKTILNYLKMPSTWRGVFTLLGVIGVTVMPEQKEAVIATALGVLALYETFRKEETKID